MADRKVVLAGQVRGVSYYKSWEFQFFQDYDIGTFTRKRTKYENEMEIALSTLFIVAERQGRFIGLDKSGIEQVIREAYGKEIKDPKLMDLYLRYCEYPTEIKPNGRPGSFRRVDVYFPTENLIKNFGIQRKGKV